jgi:hypothetical protein
MSTMYIPAPAPPRVRRGRELRALWATLAAIFLLGTGVAYGATLYEQSRLEKEATRDARRLIVDAFVPLLVPSDAAAPITGARYDQLLAAVEQRVLSGPISRLKLWRPDGTILFADRRAVVGRKDSGMRDDIHAVAAGTSESVVEEGRFKTLTSVRIGSPSIFLAVELRQSHAPIVQKARERWYPWAMRAGIAAGVSVGLYIATALFFGLFGAVGGVIRSRRQKPASTGNKTDQKADKKTDKKTDRKIAASGAGPGKNGELPGYMQPGFQEEVNARRRAEDALQTLERQRDDLLERVHRLEAELEETKRRAGMHGTPTPAANAPSANAPAASAPAASAQARVARPK